jgi:hypothetical protein
MKFRDNNKNLANKKSLKNGEDPNKKKSKLENSLFRINSLSKQGFQLATQVSGKSNRDEEL